MEALKLLTISPEILKKFPDIRIGISLLQGVSVAKRSTALKRERKEILKQFREHFTLSTFLNHHLTLAYANFYRKLGLDPQVTPPGPQNLISRLFAKNYFPTINTLVDSCNLAVLSGLVPLGIFDHGQIKGSLILRRSIPGDNLIPIGAKTPHEIPSDLPIFVDDEKVVSILYHRDSDFSKITLTTKDVLLMAVAVAGVSIPELEMGLDNGTNYILKYNGGNCNLRRFYP